MGLRRNGVTMEKAFGIARLSRAYGLRESSVKAMTLVLLVASWLAGPVLPTRAAEATSPDAALRVEQIDSADTESFLGVRVDSAGQVFVGAREALFVYEPDERGGYRPRRQLLAFPNHAWVQDIEIRGDDLFVLTVSAVYHVSGGRTKREGLAARRLLWGVPRGHTHQCFHSMAWGPEGDLYVGMGDPLWYYGDFKRPDHWGHWTFASRGIDEAAAEDWQTTPYVGVGAILRLNPATGQLQVVAEGLRNNCGLAFDRDWNLFTNDNDHESMPAEYVPGRLLHVTPKAWFGWPRGWSPEKTPDRLDLMATMNPRLGRFVPVGQAYYDDPLLPAGYRNSLLVARWCTRQVTFYPLERAGASFRATEGELLAGEGVARPVGVTVGRGGRVFVTLCHMDHNEDSPVYKSDLVMITTAADPPAHPFAGYDAATATVERLFAELTELAWSRRKEAHVELLRRPDLPAREVLDRWDAAAVGAIARPHLLWLVAIRAAPEAARPRIMAALSDSEARIRLQATRAVAERFPGEVAAVLPLFDDPDSLVRQAAVAACFADDHVLDDSAVLERIIVGPAASDDTHIRQAAVRLLAEQLDADRLAGLLDSDAPKIRLAGVLAAGLRLTFPSVHEAPAEGLPLSGWRNADAAYRLAFADGTADLSDLGRLGTFTVAEHWKAASRSAEQERLFTLLLERLADADERVRLQAAHFLSLLADPRSEPLVMDVWAKADAARSVAVAAPARPAVVPGSELNAERPAFDPAGFIGVDWQAEAARGDSRRGRLLFGEAGVGCSKCHAVAADQSVAGGPSLAEAGKRFAVGYLAESVLEPSKVVAPLFRATTVITDDGRSFTGLLAGETAESLELVVADGSRVAIPAASVEERVVQDISPMPSGLVRTPAELRDILAYLLAPGGE